METGAYSSYNLFPYFEEAMKVSGVGSEKVFLLTDRQGTRPVTLEGAKNPWRRACEALKLGLPRPRFHDLRHTWRTNARRSRIDADYAEAIMGHGDRARSVRERYGRISDKELIDAIDQMTFDNGETEILVAKFRIKAGDEVCAQNVRKTRENKKRPCSAMA